MVKIKHLLTGLALWLSASSSIPAIFEVAQHDPKATDDGPGSVEQPWKTLTRAAAAIGAGDSVLIRDGTYRERVVFKNSGTATAPIAVRAAPGAHVVITGADRLLGWKRAEGPSPVFQVHWPYKFNTWSKTMTHPGDEYHRLIGRCEQVMIEGYLLRQVSDLGQLAPGTFFVDITNQSLLAWDFANRDLNKTFAEASVRQELVRVEGASVHLKGLHFRYAANAAQHGAVVLNGEGDLLEDCVIEKMNSSGATFAGAKQVVRRCVFRDNGQIGFGANGAHQLLFAGCLVENNNTKGFDRGWEAGGNKLVLTRGAILEHSRFVRNRGNGIWFDIGNEDCTVRYCDIAENEDSGIFYEISFGLHAHDNVITGNGFAETPGAWGAQAGISLSSSPGCVLERNLLLGNREGFNFREQNRSTPRIGQKGEVPIWNHDQKIQNNIIAFNRDAQLRGWFDVKDGRHWPSPKGQTQMLNRQKPRDIAERYQVRDQQTPTGLTLEKLNLRFEKNIYFAAAGQKWFEWGVSWGQHESFAALRDFQAALGIDHESQTLDPRFNDLAARDYRIGRNRMDLLRPAYPREPVPEVQLGALP